MSEEIRRGAPSPSGLAIAELDDLVQLQKYAALGLACEANGLAEFSNNGEMLFQPPADVYADLISALRARVEELEQITQRLGDALAEQWRAECRAHLISRGLQ
jgi:hypothetical protein